MFDYFIRAWLEIKFCGQITRNLEGFFSTPFLERGTGNTRMGAATMFAATEARTCFPCFDEPGTTTILAADAYDGEDDIIFNFRPQGRVRHRDNSRRGPHSYLKHAHHGLEVCKMMLCWPSNSWSIFLADYGFFAGSRLWESIGSGGGPTSFRGQSRCRLTWSVWW